MSSRKSAGILTDYEIAWVVREVVKLTDMKIREIAEKVADYLDENADSLSEYESRLGNSIAAEFDTLWPTEGLWPPGQDATRALDLIRRACNPMMGIPDVVRAKRFELTDDEGTVRATLGFEKVTPRFSDSASMAPSLVLMDEGGERVASIGLDYFDAPELWMRNSTRYNGGEHKVALKVENDEASLVIQGQKPKLEIQDGNEATRFKVELRGGDQRTEPRVTISDNQGEPRMELALDEVEHQEVAVVGEGVLTDYEVGYWTTYAPRIRMLDGSGEVMAEFPTEEEEQV